MFHGGFHNRCAWRDGVEFINGIGGNRRPTEEA